MSAPDLPPPRRRAFWADMRFVLGVLLVIASVVGVWFVVASARQTIPVFAATRTLVPGDPVTSADVRVVDVALGQIEDVYATPGVLAADAVATRTIRAGELVPVSAVGAASAATMTTIVLRSATDVPTSVDTGSVVEIWSAPQLERGEYDEPRILVADATVASVTHDDSVMGTASAALEVVIARSDVPATLSAISGGAALSVVPAAGAPR